MSRKPESLWAKVTAVTAFYSIMDSTNPDTHFSNPSEPPKRRKRSRGMDKNVSLEMIKNMSTDYDSPYQLASNGDLEELKSFIEIFSSILKEHDKHQATLLHHAAATNRLIVMEYLIESGIDLNASDENGHTALHVATLQQHVDAVNLLLHSGIDDSILNNNEDAGLHIAVRSNSTTMVAAYLQHPHINIIVEGRRKRTPLHVIAEYDNLEACEVFHNSILVQEAFKKKTGFRLCASDEDDLTPIHLAARKDSFRVLDFCMTCCKQHGYPAEVILGFLDEENSTPLHAAVDGGNTRVVEVLLKHGANPTVTKDSQVSPFHLACSQGRLEVIDIMMRHSSNESDMISSRDIYGQTCLHRCTQSINCGQMITYLVDRGAEINPLDNKGQTPLMIAIIIGSTAGVSALLEKGADVIIKDAEGNNIMHHAVTRNRKKILGLLLVLPMAEALVMSVNNKGQSPIHHSLKLGLSDLVYPMVSIIKKQLQNIKDDVGNNYLHLAAQGSDWKTISRLLEISECLKLVNEVNKHGGTPLHMAASGGNVRCVELLLSHGAMAHRCHKGTTPFMIACYKGHADVARILFEAHPFQLKWTNDGGDNSLHMGATSGNPSIITLLLDIGVSIVHNHKLESFLDVIILRNDLKCAAAVIQHSRYQEALDLVSPVHQHPMINLVINMPFIAKQVLDRCHTKADMAHQNPDYWEKFDFKYLRLDPCSGKSEEEEESPKAEESDIDDRDMMSVQTIKYRGSITKTTAPVIRSSKRKSCISHLQCLTTMVRYNRSELLTHPASDNFLRAKWRNYGKWIHITLVSLFFLQVAFLFLFTALVPPPAEVMRVLSMTNDSVQCGDGTNGTIKCLTFSLGANACRFITLGLAGLNLIVWILNIINVRQKAFNINNISVWSDLLAVCFTFFYLVPARGLDNAFWSAGAVATFFCWFSLVLRIQLFDIIGVYITMFLTITRTVFQVFLVCFLFLMSFSISLYILAGNLTRYSKIGYSLFVNFGHLLGELDYESFVEEDVNGNLQVDWLTFIFVSVLAILMGIVIMNLLIGLAVGDIEQIRHDAIASKKQVEVTFFSQIDSILPSKLLAKLDKLSYTKYPNSEVFIIRRLWRVLWHTIKGNSSGHAELGADVGLDQGTDYKSRELSILHCKVENLTLKQDKMLETLAQMQTMQETIMKMIAAKGEEEEECFLPEN